MKHRFHYFHSSSRPRRGFTLLELVLALAMVGILALTLYASLNIAFRSSRSAEAAIEPNRTLALTMNLLGQDIQNAITPNITLTTPLAGSFEGTQTQDDRGHEGDDLIFYSTADSPQHVAANGDIKQIELTVVTDATTGDHCLVRRVSRNLLTQVAPSPDEEVLCRGVGSLTFSYFDGTTWQTSWDSTAMDNTIPAAVQVILQLERKLPNGQLRTTNYSHIFFLSCSTAATDVNLTGGTGL